jgi:predicted ATPase/class 3 adenylate cyclase
MDVAADLSDEDLASLGLLLGHRRKFMAAAQAWRREGQGAGAVPQPASSPSGSAPSAERRQVTVLFSDLVGSTELSGQIDPEDMSRLLRAYRDACAAAVARHRGYLAKFLGDGVLAYFGFPLAQEDSGHDAVRAGLEIGAAVGALLRPGGGPLQTRVGIATGMVVVGELIGSGASQEQNIVGDTPNLAARLQSLAEPGSVVVSAATRRLLGESFELKSLGEPSLKGFAQPQPVWLVMRELPFSSRFSSSRGKALSPLVGREAQLATLLAAWQRATKGGGSAVLVHGEAGVGKSRLTEALYESIGSGPHTRIVSQCSPYHANSALYPVIQTVERLWGVKADDATGDRFERLQSGLAACGCATPQAIVLLAEVLGLPLPAGLPLLDLTAAQRRSATLDELANVLIAQAQVAPLLLVIEDLHWCDPSTQDLVGRIVGSLGESRVMAVITHRPDFHANWVESAGVLSIGCARLDSEHCLALIRNVAGVQGLPPALAQEILKRSDGVPLFVEELTRTVVEERSSVVPPTLQDSLMARLDRLGPVKEIAQAAAVIGREFSSTMVEALVPSSADRVQDALGQLVSVGLILPVPSEGQTAFTFRHALLREAAYESLLRTKRLAMHRQIAEHLQSDGSSRPEAELVAHHYGLGGDPELACRWWELAADHATASAASAESVTSLQACLEQASKIGRQDLRKQRRLEIQIKLGVALFALKGPADPEYEAAIKEIFELTQDAGTVSQQFIARWGLFTVAMAKLQLQNAKIQSAAMYALRDKLDDEKFVLEAYHHFFGSSMLLGEVSNAIRLCDEAIAKDDPRRNKLPDLLFLGHDPGICAHGCRGVALALAGQVREARQTRGASVELAERLRHPASIAYANYMAALVSQLLVEPEQCREHAEALIALSGRYDLPVHRRQGEFLLGWALAQSGDLPAGLSKTEYCYREGPIDSRTQFVHCAHFADILRQSGRVADAFALVNGMIGESGDARIGLLAPDLWRLRGDLRLQLDANRTVEAERDLLTAVDGAKFQQAPLLELRAAISLARLRADQGRRLEAQSALHPLLALFAAEGDHHDVRTATLLAAQIA